VLTIATLALALQVTARVPAGDCTDEDARLVALVSDEVRRGGRVNARGDVEARLEATQGRCLELVLLQTALRGWAAARTLLPLGGGDHSHREAVRRILDGLAALASGPLAMDAEYADVAVRAYVAAAQDERPEMELLLTHARDLSERLAARGRRALWPRPFNLLAGELWLEVDRYEEARAAFERAVREEPTPMALIGLGRALDRLDRRQEACQAFRQVRGATHELATQLSALIAGCP
jgi:hypothetical protein